jgi:hypothetical protein
MDDVQRKVVVDDLRPFPELHGRPTPLFYFRPRQAPDSTDEPKEYVIDKILAHRGSGKGLRFKVRWRGYGSEDDTWEPLSTFVPSVSKDLMDYAKLPKNKNNKFTFIQSVNTNRKSVTFDLSSSTVFSSSSSSFGSSNVHASQTIMPGVEPA